MQTPAVQVALDPLQMQSTAAPPGLGNHHLATSRPRNHTITAPPVASVATLARRGAGGSIGITRFLTTHNIKPATSLPATGATGPSEHGYPVSAETSIQPLQSHQVNTASANNAAHGNQPLPYHVPQPQYNRRTTYMPARISHRHSSRPSRATQSATPSGQWFTKTVLLVDSTDDKIPRGARRQQLHKMGAVIHLVDFFTGWDEWKVRDVIEKSPAGMIDDSKPTPRYESRDTMHIICHLKYTFIDFNFSRLLEEIL